MCLILVAWQQHPEYPLVVAANRDEFFSRPTAAAGWMPAKPTTRRRRSGARPEAPAQSLRLLSGEVGALSSALYNPGETGACQPLAFRARQSEQNCPRDEFRTLISECLAQCLERKAQTAEPIDSPV